MTNTKTKKKDGKTADAKPAGGQFNARKPATEKVFPANPAFEDAEHLKMYHALCDAIMSGDANEVRGLISKGVKVNTRLNNGGLTHLIRAAQDGKTEIVGVLLDNGANIDATDHMGATALMAAAKWGCSDVVDLLIRRKANVNQRDMYGQTALIVVMGLTHHETVLKITRALLAAKADFTFWDRSGSTALMLAEQHRHNDAAILLIGAGAKQ